VAELAAEFGADPSVVSADVVGFLDELEVEGMVRALPSPAAGWSAPLSDR
jgi:hypothetical protein